jgi:hypothetical protein
MKKLLIMASLCAAASLCSPPPSEAAQVQGGVKFGANIAFIHGPDVGKFPGGESDWVLRFGLCGGGFVALPLSETFAIQAEALITTKGSKEVGPLFEDYGTYIYSLMITYLEIPVLARLKTRPTNGGFQLFGLAGPALSFKLGSRYMRSGEVLAFDGVKSSDLGLVVSVGSILTSKSAGRFKGSTEFRYTAGLSKIIEVGGVPLNIKNGVFSIIIGFSF